LSEHVQTHYVCCATQPNTIRCDDDTLVRLRFVFRVRQHVDISSSTGLVVRRQTYTAREQRAVSLLLIVLHDTSFVRINCRHRNLSFVTPGLEALHFDGIFIVYRISRIITET